jgi:hypothetical protein
MAYFYIPPTLKHYLHIIYPHIQDNVPYKIYTVIELPNLPVNEANIATGERNYIYSTLY